MKLIVLTYGTEGDTRPLAALCRTLLDAGHDVCLYADRNTLGSAKELNIPHEALSGNIKEQLADMLKRGKGVNATVSGLSHIANQETESWMRQAAAAAQDCDGIIVSGLTAFVGLSVAEYLKTPLIGAGMIPISPTRSFPSPFIPSDSLPAFLNRPSHHMVNWLLWFSFRKAVNQARKSVLGMNAKRRLWTGHPMLYGVSPALLPPPDDWPDNTRLCGQWREPALAWEPPASLQAFLASGDPPIFLGFGSMVGFDQNHLLSLFTEVLGNERVIIQSGWSQFAEAALPDHFLKIDHVPHDWLFPRVSMAIHHGGSGTTHSACRAGIPSIALPFAGDQFFWASQLKKRGIMGSQLSTKTINATTIRQSIDYARTDKARSSAAELGRQMTNENGNQTALNMIESLLEQARKR